MATSEPEPAVPSGSGRLSLFRTIQNQLEPDGTVGQPAVGFWSRPLNVSYKKLKRWSCKGLLLPFEYCNNLQLAKLTYIREYKKKIEKYNFAERDRSGIFASYEIASLSNKVAIIRSCKFIKCMILHGAISSQFMRMGHFFWIPQTPCGRFKKHLTQRECEFQPYRFIWHF